MKNRLPFGVYGSLSCALIFLFLFSPGVQAQIQSDGPNSAKILYVGGEAVPPISWPTSKTKGYMMFTGGSQVFGDMNSPTNGTIVREGQYGAPKPRAGNSCYRFHVERRPDLAPQYCRSELYWGNGDGENTGARWYAVSMYLPTDWGFDTRPIGLGYDFKFPDAQGPANLNLKLINDRLNITHQYPQGAQEKYYDIGKVVLGQWMDFAIYFRRSTGSDGLIEVYINKNKVLTITGPNSAAQESYVLWGPYKWQYITENGQGEGQGTYNGPITVYYDELRIGGESATIETISPGGFSAPPANTAPTAQSGNNQTITLPTNSVNLTGTGSDRDGSIARYAWTKVSGPSGGNIQNPSSASTQITGLTEGTYVYRLTVTDDDGATGSDDVTITVNPAAAANNPPKVYAGDNITITLPASAVTFAATASDDDGRVASVLWTKINGPGGETIATNDALSTRVSGLVAGTYTFRLTVTDDKGATSTDDITVTVNQATAPPPNAAPTANAGANKSITLPVNTVNLTGSGQDTDGTISDYSWTKVSGPSGGAIATPDAAATDITGLNEGTYVYRLTVTDNDGATSSDDVTITVNGAAAPPANVAPQAVAGANQVITLPTNSVILNGSGTDTDGSITKYAWAKVSGPNSSNIVTNNAASTRVTNLTAGTYVFRLTVSDNDGATDNDDVIVLVNPEPVVVPNVPPTASAGTDISIRLPVNTVTLNGSGADDDGKVAGYSWTKVSGPSGGTFLSPTAQSTSFNALIAGTYVVRLTVTDDDGATTSDEVQVIVRPAAATPANEAPNANAGADIRIILPTNSVTLNGVGTDVDGTIASYNWTKVSGPAAGTIINVAAQSTGVTGLVEGVYSFRLTIVDDDGAKSTDEVKVTVRKANNAPANQAPTASAGSDRVIQLPVSTVNLRGTAVDPDGTVVSYNWKKKSGPAAGTIQSAESIGTSVVDLKEGEYVYRFTAKDDKGAEGSAEIKVTVKAAAPAPVPNKMPVADAGADITLNLPSNSAALNGSKSSDPDGTITSYRWVMVKGPVTGTMANANLQIANLSDLVEGVYEFELTVFDNDGASSVDRVQVTVIGKNSKPVAVVSDTITVYLPAQNAQIDASQSYDSDGTIQSFYWTKKSGPGSPRLLSPNNSKTIITDLVMGTYQFNITITDNDGAETVGTVTVVVKNSSARRLIPVINLYPNPAETQVTLTIDSEVDGRSDVVFYDLLGRPVLRDTFNKNSRTYQRKLNISNLSDGVYAVEISIDQAEKVVRKVVKQ